MFRLRTAWVGAALFLALSGGVSCSDSNDDDLGTACHNIVVNCHVGTSVGGCIDELGDAGGDCVGCLADQGCDYPTCQRLVQGCRVPLDLLKD